VHDANDHTLPELSQSKRRIDPVSLQNPSIYRDLSYIEGALIYPKMAEKALILRHFDSVRRRSIKLWTGLHPEFYHWRPDPDAMSALELIRHVLQADYGWNIIISKGDMTDYHTPWEGRPLLSVEDELHFAEPHRVRLLKTIEAFTEEEVTEGEIIHPGNEMVKNLGDYLLRIGYHESVHAGQFLSYMRSMNIPRPSIWD